MGQSPPSSLCNEDGNGLPFFQGNADFGHRYPVAHVWIEQEFKVGKEGDILVSVRAPVGELNVANERCVIGRGLAAIRPTQTEPMYAYFLMHERRRRMEALGQGSTFDAINNSDLRDLDILLPPLPEQKKIAAILSSVDEAIQATQAVIEQTRRVKEGLLQELLTKGIGHTRFKQTEIGEIPEGWEIAPIAEVSRVIDCKHRTPAYSDSGFPVVRPGDVGNGALSLEGCLVVSQGEYDDLIEKHRPQVGDIVYSRNQNYGASAYVEEDLEFAIGQDVCIIQPTKLRTLFMHYTLSSEVIWKQIRRIMAGSTFKRINLGDIRKFKVPVVPVEEQRAVEAAIFSVDVGIRGADARVANLRQVKAGLLQDLLTGKVRVSV